MYKTHSLDAEKSGGGPFRCRRFGIADSELDNWPPRRAISSTAATTAASTAKFQAR